MSGRAVLANTALTVRQPVFTAVMANPSAVVTAAPARPLPPVRPQRPFIVDIAQIKRIDPLIGVKLSRFPWLVGGVERNRLTAPVAPSDTIALTTIFEEPLNAAQKYCWPRYEVDVEGNSLYRVRYRKEGAGSRLVVHLRRPALNPGGMKELTHEVAVLLSFSELVNGRPSAVAEIPLPEVTVEGDVIRAEVLVTQLAQRDQVYRAMTEPDLGARLVVRLSARVAVPVPQKPPVDAQGATLPGVAVKQLYRESERVVDLPLPFLFPTNLHGYVFEGLGTVRPGAGGGLLRRQVNWGGRFHSYYQAGLGNNVFYYLPDTFKLARRPAPPHEPFATVRFQSADGSLERMQAGFSFFAAPVLDQERLLGSVPVLRGFADADVLRTEGDLRLEPLLPSPENLKLRLSYPGADTQGGPFEIRPGATVDLRTGVADTLAMPMVQFQSLYDALFSASGFSLAGAVSFQMGDVGEEIPFTLRLRDTAEPLVGWVQQKTALTLTNEIESPLVFQGVKALVKDAAGQQSVSAPGPVPPIRLAVGQSARFQLPGGVEVVDVDLSGAEAETDRERIFSIVLDPSTAPVYLRPLVVKTFKAMFAAPAARPEQQVMAIVLDFEGGLTVELNADQLDQKIQLPVPVANYVLRRADVGSYRYKMNVIRLSGQSRDTDWRTDDTGTLFPNVR